MGLPEKWLTVDPGEDTGYAVWSGEEFLDHGTEKMWYFSDRLWEEAIRQQYPELPDIPEEELGDLERNLRGITMLVTEQWQLYPWKLRDGSLDWDECRTARLIGSMFQACRFTGWVYEQQEAKIKERAVAAGAENFFSHPLRENRHANDATMHGVFRIAVEQKQKWTDMTGSTWIVDA